MSKHLKLNYNVLCQTRSQQGTQENEYVFKVSNNHSKCILGLGVGAHFTIMYIKSESYHNRCHLNSSLFK